MLLNDIYKIISLENSSKFKNTIILSITNLVLDFLSILLLVPIFISVFSPEFQFKTINSSLFTFLNQYKNNQIELLLSIVLFYILKNLIALKITKYQSDYYYHLSNLLSVNLLRDYFNKTLLEVKKEKNSALIKDIVFVPNNFVVYVLSSVIQLISEALLLVLILLGAVLINPLVSLFLIIITSMIVLSLYFYDKNQLKDINSGVSEKYNSTFNHLMNAINGYVEIKTNRSENYFLQKFNSSNSALNKMHSKLNTNRLIKPKHTETFLIIIISSLFLLSKYISKDYNLNVLFISFLFASSIKIIPSINRILTSLTNLKTNLYTVDILKKSNLEKNEKIVSKEKVAFEDKIELKDIHFKYPDLKPILKSIFLTIHKGEIIGILGDSGNGKSTLINIITTLINPDSGEFFCDAKRINTTNKTAFLELISYVPQSPFILEGTILENLLLDDNSIKMETINEYLELFDLKTTIDSLPKRLNTFIGSNGYALSGGQLQRLAIIRALIRKPQLLLLDEALNQLDINLRTKIIGQLKIIAKTQNLTLITISHNKKELEQFCDTLYELKNSDLILIK
jgi:ABC-type bacteriocin/lantibiotic exporter with double-glycine peptidase domain